MSTVPRSVACRQRPEARLSEPYSSLFHPSQIVGASALTFGDFFYRAHERLCFRSGNPGEMHAIGVDACKGEQSFQDREPPAGRTYFRRGGSLGMATRWQLLRRRRRRSP